MAQRQLTIDSREFTVYDEGDPAGPTILVHHGTPAAGAPYSGWVMDANARGARLITYDRPGYGASTPAPGRTVSDAARDAAAIMGALGVRRFATWGCRAAVRTLWRALRCARPGHRGMFHRRGGAV